jgi:hypothetical protein
MQPTTFLLFGGRKTASGGGAEAGAIVAGRDYFTDQAGTPWSYQGCTAFLLYYRWLLGEDIGPFCDWAANLGANVLRVLGMVYWQDKGQMFGPTLNDNWWPELAPFLDYLAGRGLRVEFTVFADTQHMMPDPQQQRVHLRRVVDEVGNRWNVVIEVCNEPWQNGVDPPAIFGAGEPRACPMAYGVYDFTVTQRADGLWIATLPVLDYVTVHNSRDPDAWSRKAKDNAEMRDGSGDGSAENAPLWDGCHIPPVGDEPMGAAEADQLAGRQRSNIPQDHFWYHANARINGAGSTFHSDNGLQAELPPKGGDQQKCGDATALAWASIEPEYQTGDYTRSGLTNCPLVFNAAQFPEQTSRIYARLLGDRAVAVAIKPTADWTPAAAPGWRIVSTVGPQASLVHLERG